MACKGSGFKSPQFHPRSMAQSDPGLARFLALPQQICSNRYCAAVALSVGVAGRAAFTGWRG
jgi:hypothetical protein